MEIKRLDNSFTVCKVQDYSLVSLEDEYCFIGKTDEENSLVCKSESVPDNVIEREDGWKAFRIQGVLDFFNWDIIKNFNYSCRERNWYFCCINI